MFATIDVGVTFNHESKSKVALLIPHQTQIKPATNKKRPNTLFQIKTKYFKGVRKWKLARFENRGLHKNGEGRFLQKFILKKR